MTDRSKEISEYFEFIWAEDDVEEKLGAAESILKSDPDNPAAKYVKWQLTDDEGDGTLDLLTEAVASLKPDIEDDRDSVDEDVYSSYTWMLVDLASALYLADKKDSAMEVAERFMDMDRDGYIVGRIIYYGILAERHEYARIIEAVDSDICQSAMGEYVRAIALFETEGPGEEASDALLEAISLDPDLVFFILGVWAFDDEDIESIVEEDDLNQMDEQMMQAALLSELWMENDERMAFLNSVAFAFGYLTGRLGSAEDIELLENAYKKIGCLEEITEAKDVVHALLAKGADQTEIDEEALMAFRDLRDRGIFN